MFVKYIKNTSNVQMVPEASYINIVQAIVECEYTVVSLPSKVVNILLNCVHYNILNLYLCIKLKSKNNNQIDAIFGVCTVLYVSVILLLTLLNKQNTLGVSFFN